MLGAGAEDHPAMHENPIFGMKVQRVPNTLGSMAKLAHWAGVSRSQVTRWSDGQTEPSAEAARAITDLEFIISRASMVSDDVVIQDWLEGRNALLGGATPLEMVLRGRTSQVLDAIVGDEAEVFA